MQLHHALGLFIALGLAALTSCATAQGPAIGDLAGEVNGTRIPHRSVIVPGDVLDVRVADSPELEQEVLVLADGTANFIGLEDGMEIAGLQVEQLRERLSAAYEEALSRSSVSVQMRTPAIRTVSVLGEVTTPGAVPLGPEGRLTLVDAIAQSGGFLKQSAWLSNTLLVRWDAVEQRQLAWKIDARPMHWGHAETILLQPFDLVYIPNTPIDRVGIWVDNYIRRLIPVPILIPTG